MWDPAQYLQFADERSRPFFELAGRIQAADPDLVVDLGCGPGQLTATLAGRWPGAEVIGIDSHIDTMLTEYRQRGAGSFIAARGEGELLGACLTDRLADGLSLVYSFYAPHGSRRSLGAYMILDHIDKARRLGLPHVYLGYWVEGSKKMAYKAAYLPQERLGLNGWERVERG